MYLLGASGHCKVIIDIIERNKSYQIQAVLDDNPRFEFINGIRVIKRAGFSLNDDDLLFISIGNNLIRKKMSQKYSVSFPVLIHPQAIIGNNIILDEGCVIMAGAVINPNTKIGKHCIINSNSVVEHDCHLEDFVHVSPNAALAGGVFVGEGTHIGIGACVIPGVKIGKWTTIGAGCVIIKDIPDFAVVTGNPGKVIKFNKENE
jgi:sugar O-acyltransferase (sialic acid O-acetyltransferase NeuD family)